MMRFKAKTFNPTVVTVIVRQMIEESWEDWEIARFLRLWHQSDRVVTIMAWLSKPEDTLDRKLYEYLKPFVLVDE
jgi:hypothetical protein